MRAALVAAALVASCVEPPVVAVGGITVDLVTPADVDPLAGADVLFVRVLDAAGRELARATGTPSDGLTMPAIPTFGLVEIEVTAQGSGIIRAAARTGLIAIQPGEERRVDTLFLPVNQPIALRWSPAAARVGHGTLRSPDGRVLLVGGRPPSSTAVSATTEWWDPRLGFGGDGPPLPSPQAQAGAAVLADGALLLAGGIGATGPTAAVTRVGPDGASAQALTPLATASDRVCVAPHPTLGALVFAGGPLQVYSGQDRLGQAPDYDTSPVTACAAVGDRVIVAGDAEAWGVLDLGRATWPTAVGSRFTRVGGMLDVDGAMAIGLPDGTGFVAGGFGPDPRRFTYRIDLDAKTAARGPDLATARIEGRVAPWRDGALVLAGGFADDVRSEANRTIEILDPDRGSLLTVPAPVRAPSVTVLPGGAVLLTGGVDAGGGPAGAIAIMPWPDAR